MFPFQFSQHSPPSYPSHTAPYTQTAHLHTIFIPAHLTPPTVPSTTHQTDLLETVNIKKKLKKSCANLFFSYGVMTPGIVVGGIFLACDHHVGLEQGLVSSGSYFI